MHRGWSIDKIVREVLEPNEWHYMVVNRGVSNESFRIKGSSGIGKEIV